MHTAIERMLHTEYPRQGSNKLDSTRERPNSKDSPGSEPGTPVESGLPAEPGLTEIIGLIANLTGAQRDELVKIIREGGRRG